MLAYGPPEADVQLIETFGELGAEYAALRKACILLDQPNRGVIEVTGADRLEFLNRMLTQELKGILPFHSRPSFWLNRKGRIDADLRITSLPDRLRLDLDIHSVQRTLEGLGAFIIVEDVQLADLSESTHRFALHGPTAVPLLQAVGETAEGPPLSDLTPDRATCIQIAGHRCVVERSDTTGEVGLELTVESAAAATIYNQLIEAGQEHNGHNGDAAPSPSEAGAARFKLRPAGWHAFNIARIEAGTPIYNIDFGPNSLPHETGIIRQRVSFTKGCYLGQEIVARMESRGHSKGRITALRFDQTQSHTPAGDPRLPVAGAHIWSAAAPDADPVGAITSSTLSPMLGGEPIAFAMLKHDQAAAGNVLLVAADDTRIAATTQPELTFWKRSGA